MSLPNKLMFAATVVIAVATVVNVTSGSTQTDKLIKHADRIATAMEQSVGQAKVAFDAANKQAMVTQRAWIATSVTLAPPRDAKGNLPKDPFIVDKPFDVRIEVKNTGRTPALNVRIFQTKEAIGAKGYALPEPNFAYAEDSYSPAGNITPDGYVYFDHLSILTRQERERIFSSTERIWVHGAVKYDDVFGAHHLQHFCVYLLTGGAFANCTDHNDMD
jgi:hypothetical protein